ncbi:hypothetical protein ACQEV2_03695 [Streptomyces sp. CA-251387]
MNDGTEPSASHVITLRRERAQAVLIDFHDLDHLELIAGEVLPQL